MRASFINVLRIIGIVLFISTVIFINHKFTKIENSNKEAFIQYETTFVVDSIERLSRAVLIHLYNSDSSFYQYMPYLSLYNFVDHQDSVVKKKNVNGFYVYKYDEDYKQSYFIKGYD
jgi:hypothetical protein